MYLLKYDYFSELEILLCLEKLRINDGEEIMEENLVIFLYIKK